MFETADEFARHFRERWEILLGRASRVLKVADAEDAVQELFLRLFRNWHTIQQESAMGFYLTALEWVITDKLRDQCRKIRRNATLSQELIEVLADPQGGPPSWEYSRTPEQCQSQMRDVLNHLEPRQRAVLLRALVIGDRTTELQQEPQRDNLLGRVRRTLRTRVALLLQFLAYFGMDGLVHLLAEMTPEINLPIGDLS
jgi:RNA polymerase sigma factor (sigma-70 family)